MNLGQKVRVKRKLVRTRKPGGMMGPVHIHEWVPVEINTDGVYVGKRSIHIQGRTEFDDGYYYFVPKETKRVNLIAINERQVVYVLPEDCEEIENVS